MTKTPPKSEPSAQERFKSVVDYMRTKPPTPHKSEKDVREILTERAFGSRLSPLMLRERSE